MTFIKINQFIEELNTFNESLNEGVEPSSESDAMQMIEEMRKIYAKEMPNSRLRISFRNLFEGNITIRMQVGNDKKEWPNGIEDNDIAIADFMVNGFDKEGNVSGQLEFINTRSGFGFYIKPESPYLAYSRHKIRFRKAKGDSKKILAAFKKTVQKLKSELKANVDKIPDSHAYAKTKV